MARSPQVPKVVKNKSPASPVVKRDDPNAVVLRLGGGNITITMSTTSDGQSGTNEVMDV